MDENGVSGLEFGALSGRQDERCFPFAAGGGGTLEHVIIALMEMVAGWAFSVKARRATV